MLFIIMHEEFALKTAHLIQHTDIRHKAYLNMISGMNRKKTVKLSRGIYIAKYFIFRRQFLIVATCFRNAVASGTNIRGR